MRHPIILRNSLIPILRYVMAHKSDEVRRSESTKVALMAAHRSTDNIVDGICHAIVKAEQSNLKVGINDEGFAQLDERNNTAISAFKQALDKHENWINDLLLTSRRNSNESAILRRVHTSTVAPMHGCSA